MDDLLRRVAHAPAASTRDVPVGGRPLPALPEAGEVIDGRYRVERVLGEGGMGVVLGAVDLRTQAPVALKFMRRDMVRYANDEARFEREARIASKLRHPNVVAVFDVGRHALGPYIVMEHLSGCSLAQYLRNGAMDIDEAVRVALAAARGVAHAHAIGVIHRDIKPGNIFLAQQPHTRQSLPKLLDFGISRSVEPTAESKQLTRTGATLGTPAYMSLEQLMGKKLDFRADVYSLGVVLFEALAGRLPFETSNPRELAVSIATQTPPSVQEIRPEVPDALALIVKKALATEPEDRHADAASLAEELERWQAPRPLASWIRPAIWAVPAALVVALVLSILATSSGTDQPAGPQTKVPAPPTVGAPPAPVAIVPPPRTPEAVPTKRPADKGLDVAKQQPTAVAPPQGTIRRAVPASVSGAGRQPRRPRKTRPTVEPRGTATAAKSEPREMAPAAKSEPKVRTAPARQAEPAGQRDPQRRAQTVTLDDLLD